MKPSRPLLPALAILVAVGLLTAGHAHAAFDKDELKCRKGLAKNFTRAVLTGHKVLAGCHKDRNKGKIDAGTDCNDITAVDAAKGKFAKSKDKVDGHVLKKCIDAGLDDDVLDLFISCSDDCTAAESLPNPLTSYAELGTCLGCYAGELAEGLSVATMGAPGAPMSAKEDQKCHQGIAKNYAKLLKTILKGRTKCQDGQEKTGAMSVAETGCAAADPGGKIIDAGGKAAEGMAKSCEGATLANLDSCSDVDLPALIACLAAETNAIADVTMPAAYELDPTVCPTGLLTTIRAGTPPSGPATSTRLDSGWNGIGHGQDLVDGYTLGTAIDCANPSPPCGDCTVTGVADVAGSQHQAFTRCEGDATIECSTPFTTDAVCPGAQQCGYYLGPPLPLNASNTMICTVIKLTADLGGTVNIDGSGNQLTTTDVRAIVHTGDEQTRPCPLCGGTCTAPPSAVGNPCSKDVNCDTAAGICSTGNVGFACDVDTDCDTSPGAADGTCGDGVCSNYDPVAQDGVQGGTCHGGTRDGLPCDVQGFDSTFAPTPGTGTSLDCAPSPLSNVSGAGLGLDLELTTGSVSLPFGTNCDFPLGTLACACAVCSGNTTLACNSNADCAGVGAGTCTSNGGGATRQPDDCSPVGSCAATTGDLAECPLGPAQTYCDGELRANGGPFLTCNINADCRSLDGSCGNGTTGSCGDCTLSLPRPCFVDPVAATGTPSISAPVTVSAFCSPPTTSSAVNGAAGIPGPTRVSVQNEIAVTY